MRMIAAITISPKATDARTVTKLAVELMDALHRDLLGDYQPWG
jgi:hypothetical protein